VLLGRVVGTVVATRKDPNLVGLRFLLVEELDSTMKGTARHVVAADAVGAGSGEIVLYSTGSSARLTEATRDRPVDAVLMAIVDVIESGGEAVYQKSRERPASPSGTRAAAGPDA
jgi:microcompartment protein CcmK/EutM